MAIADIDEKALEKTKKDFFIENSFNDPMELVKNPDIDAIDITSSEDTHGYLSIESIKHGKHVFIEKPIATTYKESEEIYRLAKKNNVQVMVGNISRFSMPYLSIKDAIKSGKLGEIGLIRTKRNFSKKWFEEFGKRTHPVFESGIHDIDLILWYINSRCVEVYSKDYYLSNYKYPDLFSTIFTFENGVIASLDSAWLHPEGGPKNLVETLELDGTIDADLEICGAKGTANYKLAHSGYSIWTEEEVLHPELTLWTNEYGEVGGAIYSELKHFIEQALTNKHSLIAPLSDSVEALKIAEAIVQSAEEKRVIYL